jgi:flagellar basal-body rod modification protein FlgD
VAITTDVQGIVDSADVTQTPPVLSIGDLTFTLDQIKRVVRQTATDTATSALASFMSKL